MLVAAFVAVRFFGVNIILIILFSGAIGALDTWIRHRKQKEAQKNGVS